MRTEKSLVRRGVFAGAAVLAISGVFAWVHAGTAQAAASQGGRVTPRVTEAVDEAQRVVLRGNVHPKARPEFDRGAVSDAQPITKMMLLLQRSPEQEAELRQLMEEQQAKNSANFHAWLTPEEFGRRFGPADEDVQAVTDWLSGHGFGNISVTKGRTLVQFAGTAGQVRSAFGTAIHKYNVKGEEHFANERDPQIPAALAPVVKGVVSLHNFRPRAHVHNLGTVQRNAKTGEIRPMFTFTDVNGTFYALGPGDFAKIYNVPAAFDGTGQSIAIVGQSNINLQDVTQFRSIFGLPAYSTVCTGTPGQCQLTVVLNGPDPGLVSGDETESDLDVQWSGAVAPGATINFVTTQTTETDFVAGVDASAVFIVDNNVAPILSESYGSCEAALGSAGNAFRNTLWQQAAAEGITVLVSSGDNGAAGCDPAASPANQNAATLGVGVSGFASTPFNVAVGGTDFDDATTQTTFFSASNTAGSQASALGYIPETTWNDSCARTAKAGSVTGICTTVSSTGVDLIAGGGGSSSVYTGALKPGYQTGFGDANRDLPDVSLFASDGGPTAAPTKTFYVICESDQDITGDTGCNLTTFSNNAPFHDFQAVGGTSASTPAFAAIVALINQAKGGGRQGNANYALYNTYNAVKSDATKLCNSSSFAAPSPSNNCVFYDITKGNVSVACQGGKPNCSNTSTAANQFGVLTTSAGGTTPAFATGAGYDLATGLGSVNVSNLITAWAPPSRTAPTSVTLTSPTTFPITSGASATFSGSVTGSGGTPTGPVILENAATHAAIDTTTLTSGAFNLSTMLLPGGTYNVVAHYGGDTTFGTLESAPLAVTVNSQASQTVVSFVTFDVNGAPTLNTGAVTASYGSSYILRVDVKNASGATCENLTTAAVSFVCPTGTVQLFNGTAALNDFPNAQTANATNVATLNERGFAEDQPIQLVPGAYSITAKYSGDGSYTASTSAAESVTINKATTSAAVTSNVASVAAGGSVTLTATISTTSNGAGPTGTVQFKNGSSNLGAAAMCTPTPFNTNTGASALCTATLMTTLSEGVPLGRPEVRSWPRGPVAPVVIVLLLMVMLATYVATRRAPASTRLRYAAAGLILFACVAAGIAGCSGGGGGGGGGGSHADSITATYSGDANYTGSTSAAVTVTVQ